MGLRPEATAVEFASLAPGQSTEVVEFEDSEDPDSYFREHAPWKASPRPVMRRPDARTSSAGPEVRVASARRGVVDASAAPNPFPDDPEELKLWLGRRSEQAAETHRAHIDRLRTMEQRSATAANGICTGC